MPFSCADPEFYQRERFFFDKRADDGSTLNAGLVTLPFSGDPDQYY